MKYKINKQNYHDFRTISVNRLEQRSYFIPYPDRASADRQDAMSLRYDSPKVMCLSGEWDFRFYPRPAEMPDEIDTDKLDFDRIDVPSCWQYRGYDRPFYVNARYQFPYRPPVIPETDKAGRVFTWFGADYGFGPRWKDPGEEYNFVGLYRTRFTVSDTTKRYVLSFLGVASCADVYVNGTFCGYSEGSHNTVEFDITDNITEGENELVVVVHRWCTGTYLECQDMFRNNGIFRDVLLRMCDDTDVFDIDFTASKTNHSDSDAENSVIYSAAAKVKLYSDCKVRFTLCGHGTELTKTVQSGGKTAAADFHAAGVKEWTAETPYLYDLYVETPGSCVKMKVGFKEVKIDGKSFLLNGQKIKLRGVNHHDTSPVNGYAMTPEEIARDVKLCKEYHIDTIRTSHYPPDPLLIQLCDEAGIYVIDEADLETHGTYFHMIPPSYNRISNDPKWAGHFVDRIKALYQRDKTHASIIMWSLGNESGGCFNTDLMYMYLKDVSALPVQYESAVHCRRKAYDVGSEMYPPAARLHDIGEGKCRLKQLNDRPYFMCEYAHAMGVGPGGIEDYWKEIYTYDNLIGGCIWEMNDHAVCSDQNESSRGYMYGGDHGEWEHDGNFCVDGLFYPDRSPSTGARVARFTYRPIRVSHLSGDKYEIFNTMSFTDGSDYILKLSWSDGAEDEIIPDVKPLSREIVEIETGSHVITCENKGIDCILTITVLDKAKNAELSTEQLVISKTGREHAHIDPAHYDILDDGSPLIRIIDGKPEIIMYADDSDDVVRVTSSDPYAVLFRAPTDNDYRMGGARNTMLPFLSEKEKVLSIDETDRRITVKTRINCKGSAFICTDIYEKADNAIRITSTLHCLYGRGDLPRFGKAFKIQEAFDQVEYYGRNGESYADMKDHTQIEHVVCRVSDMTEPNIRPQESGNRCDTSWASVSDGTHRIIFRTLGDDFDLGIKPYSDRELLGMKHRCDEKVTGTYVTISSFQQGLGTGICGPGPSPEVCRPVRRDYKLSFTISFE
ncbi:MAG: hypothetical protein IKF07_02215 [Eubacterium sp.]|nr:hypothetical protein [Eubacterium sp.]